MKELGSFRFDGFQDARESCHAPSDVGGVWRGARHQLVWGVCGEVPGTGWEWGVWTLEVYSPDIHTPKMNRSPPRRIAIGKVSNQAMSILRTVPI